MEEYIKINDEEYVSKKQHDYELECMKQNTKDELKKEIEEFESKKTELLKNNNIKTKALRFNEKQYTKLINLMSKVFEIQSESINEEWAVNNQFGVIDPANVLLVIGKTEEARRLLSIFKPFNSEVKIPTLDWVPDYTYTPKNEEKNTPELIEIKQQKCKFSQEYIIKIFNILNACEDSISITTKYDYPGLFENKDFKFILAPRITSEDK